MDLRIESRRPTSVQKVVLPAARDTGFWIGEHKLAAATLKIEVRVIEAKGSGKNGGDSANN